MHTKEHPRGEKGFVVDLKNAEYMDSSAMGMLLQLRDYGAKDQSMQLVNGNDGVREIPRIANFDKLFKIAWSRVCRRGDAWPRPLAGCRV